MKMGLEREVTKICEKPRKADRKKLDYPSRQVEIALVLEPSSAEEVDIVATVTKLRHHL